MVVLAGNPPAVAAAPVVSSKFVCRVSGLPMSTVADLADQELAGLIERLFAAEQELADSREALSAELFSAIGAVADKRIRFKLLALRRALYNARMPSASGMEAAACVLPPDVMASIGAANARLHDRDELRKQLDQVHNDALLRARLRLRAALADGDFQKGLALSSRTLFENLTRYLKAPASVHGSREEQIERGLLRYLTRMSTKATPFGTFCAVIGGEFVTAERDGPILAFDGDPCDKHSTVRLNKRIYAVLWDYLCSRPAVRARLGIELNPSLRVEADQLRFLTANGGQEIFQRLARTEVLDFVQELSAVAKGGMTFAGLATELARHPRCEADADGARAFLDRLIMLGMLRLRAVVPEQEADWSGPLASFLDAVEADPEAWAIRGLLRDLDDLRARYSYASAPDRARILTTIAERLRGGFESLGRTPPPRHELPWYEDATADARLHVTVTPSLGRALNRLGEWVALTIPLNGARIQMASMRHFFDMRYDAEVGDSVPLMTFYEDYYREHFREHLVKARAAGNGGGDASYDAGNPFALGSIQRLRAAWTELGEAVRAAWAQDLAATEIAITRQMLESALATAGGTRSVAELSVAVFGQVLREDDGAVRILAQGGRLYGGYGKYYSRFLYLLPDEWREAVFEDNARLARGTLAEICGDAAFNANLHPPLLPWEISYPTGQQGGSARQIPSAELAVARNPTDANALTLLHVGSGRRVLPVDLGFLNPFMRPPLYQLLNGFSASGAFAFPLPSSPEPRRPPAVQTQPPRIVCRPRITYEDLVVLARRRWHVPHTCYPRQGLSEADAEYFLRVAKWQRQHRIPRRVYVRVLPLRNRAPASVESRGGAPPPTTEGPTSRNQRVATPALEEVADGAAPSVHEAPGEEQADLGPVAGPRDAHIDEGRYSRDFQKPQFIDFLSPLLVRLFARLGGALTRFDLLLEECLPTMDQLPVGPRGPHAVELILQIGFPPTVERSERRWPPAPLKRG